MEAILRNGRSKDKKPREMRSESLQNIRQGKPGYMSAVVRVYGPCRVIRWFERFTAEERGKLLERAELSGQEADL